MSALQTRRCAGIRKDGEKCQSRVVEANGFCRNHNPERSREELVAIARRAGVQSVAVRREQAKSVRDRIREQVEEDFERIYAAFADALEAVTPEGSADFRARCQAAQAVLAEAYGKPAQAIIGDPDAPLSFHVVSAFHRDSDDGGNGGG